MVEGSASLIAKTGVMKAIKLIIALILLALAGIASVDNAWADRGYVRFGMMVGPYGGPWYYPSPYYYYPPMVVVSPAPQIYIERQPAPVAAPGVAVLENYWYYCAASKSYFPYVKECPDRWQRVSPQPPGQH